MSSEVGLNDAPLATFEIDEFCEEFAGFQVACGSPGSTQGATSANSKVLTPSLSKDVSIKNAAASSSNVSASRLNDNDVEEASPETTPTASSSSPSSSSGVDNRPANATSSSASTMIDNFNENFSGSLEDLVSTFDEKITKCFSNFEETTEKIAPVQVRSQEEIMNECQMWWTITGNFGNILPIDWSKSFARQNLSRSLNIRETPDDAEDVKDNYLDVSEEDEELSQAFDMHNIVISSIQQDPLFTAEEVINEIDAMMSESEVEGESSSGSGSSELDTPTSDPGFGGGGGDDRLHFKERTMLRPGELGAGAGAMSPNTYKEMLDESGLQSLSICALNELLEELEVTIKDYSETLIAELALRDELEYEKELKNQFISLLLSIQNKRRQVATSSGDKGRNSKSNSNKKRNSGSHESHDNFLTTVIPYNEHDRPVDIATLQVLIKILRAINDDSPQVPSLLTDYILKVLCPNDDNALPVMVN